MPGPVEEERRMSLITRLPALEHSVLSLRRGAARGTRTSSAVIVAALAGAVALAGCGSSGTTAAGAGSGTGGTLTVADPQPPASLDPGVGNPAYDDWVELAYDCLFTEQTDGSYKPDLATSSSYGPR